MGSEFDLDIGYGENKKNNIAWNKLFEQEAILKTVEGGGLYTIDAKKMKDITNREPRLMAKVESKYTLPTVLGKNDLCIMPHESRGNYVIGHFDAFVEVDYNDAQSSRVSIGRKYDMLNPYRMEKEPSLILSAYNYDILDEIASGEEVTMTDFGRETTGKFEFLINNLRGGDPYSISVNRSQLEMDGVFESDSYVLNIEAKMKQRIDFIGRQLYYPYRMIRDRSDKDIINIFMSYSGGSLFIHTYDVTDDENYNSLKLTGSYKYDFFEAVSVKDAYEIIRNAEVYDESPEIPFPQADTMQKVFDAISCIRDNPGITDKELAEMMFVNERQGGYYGNSCCYLGLTKRVRKRSYNNYLSPEGEQFVSEPINLQIKHMIKLLSRHKVFNHFLNECIEQDEPPTKDEIEQWIRNNIGSMDPDKKTPGRRAQTVKKWMEWVWDSCDTL